MTDGKERVTKFVYCMIECNYISSEDTILSLFKYANINLPDRQGINNIRKIHAIHPFLFKYTGSKRSPVKTLIKERIAPWREELTAKIWHPSRFQHWCLDNDEKNELIEMCGGSLIGASLTPGLRAEWNIEW
jgi:hypothetical protein